MSLVELLNHTCARHPDRVAVVDADRTCTYRELDAYANRVARVLSSRGVTQGDRVGIWADKSLCVVATMQAVLRLGAAYVPIDPASPPARVLTLLRACELAALVTTEPRQASLAQLDSALPPCMWPDDEEASAASPEPVPIEPSDLAYVLFTSGSTGVPKGVCLSHHNALAFVRWAVSELDAQPDDRFANHAPLQFDLSVLDLYAAFAVGASVVLIAEPLALMPTRLVALLVEQRITVWYSVPSALMLMMQSGGLLAASAPHLRAVLFAGEPFPIDPLRRLRAWNAGVRLLNLYGPTETNVCTFFEVGAIAADRIEPVPIGRACCGDEVEALDEHGAPVPPGGSGQLFVRGPTVMVGYWGWPPQGDTPYATGDWVRVLGDGVFQYLGRRDHMVKVRGHRIELGELEAVIAAHPHVDEVALVVTGESTDKKIIAFVVAQTPPSLIALKRHAAALVPRAMIVDGVRVLPELPRTATGKIDRMRLHAIAHEETAH